LTWKKKTGFGDITESKTMNELKRRLKKAKIDRKELAAKIGVRYMTLSGYLNGFVPMPDHIRQEIEEILKGVE